MECINCKRIGHTFRDCREPTMSYGIIAVRRTSNGPPKYLMIRRRDSLGYVDFMRGKYSIGDTVYIQTLLNQMTKTELARLQTTSFALLWSELWNFQNTRQFRNEFEPARRMFEAVQTDGLLARLITAVNTAWEEPEWGLPKGRRSQHESERLCAIREFAEETGLAAADIQLTAMPPETEEYVGSNGIAYRHVYYIATCNLGVDATVNADNRVQTREVGDIGWFTFEEAYLRIRATNPEKRATLGRIHARILGL